jgi:predicted metal-binding membrane protein
MGEVALHQIRGSRQAWRLVLQRERRVVTVALLVVAGLTWVYLFAGAGMPSMDGMDPSMVMAPLPWSPGYAVVIFLMWWIMMAAMMLPSAAPTILLYDLVARRLTDGRASATLSFAWGYMLVWGSFSLVAAILHWALDQSGLMTMAMASASSFLGGLILIGAGTWQLTPIKRACLAHCQSPLRFLSHHWRSGRFGALRMGIAHGAYCLGCCWVMMGLLFYGGVMNFAWIGGLALYILIEKSVPLGHWLTRVTGWTLILAGMIALGAQF